MVDITKPHACRRGAYISYRAYAGTKVEKEFGARLKKGFARKPYTGTPEIGMLEMNCLPYINANCQT